MSACIKDDPARGVPRAWTWRQDDTDRSRQRVVNGDASLGEDCLSEPTRRRSPGEKEDDEGEREVVRFVLDLARRHGE